MHWIMSPEPVSEPTLQLSVEDLLVSKDYLDHGMPWLRRTLLMSEERAGLIANKTEGQRTNPLWALARKLRITASNFGVVLAAINRHSFSKSLKKRLLSSYNLTTMKPIVWGITHEDAAIGAYKAMGAEVKPTGLWIHESGAIGASPDGLITKSPTSPVHFQTEAAMLLQPEVLEVKCPYSARGFTVSEAVSSVKDFYIGKADGRLYLNPRHDYYHQVQGQLYITQKTCCDFVVWTPEDTQVIRIASDSKWSENIDKLIDFYFSTCIPSIGSDE